MTEKKEKIIGAAIQVFLRFGARKASMADIAAAAGVSRQTVYDQFDGKDALIVASIRYLTSRNLAAVRARLEGRSTLAGQLRAYADESIVESFRMLQLSSDAQDLIGGHNEAGKAEMRNSYARHAELIAGLLAPYEAHLRANGRSAAQFAHFFVHASMAFKYSAQNEDDLQQLIVSLLNSTLSIAGAHAAKLTE
ncbi:MAG: TetR/AcrR family transcriptional regulator [Pseudomonadota bacterium]